MNQDNMIEVSMYELLSRYNIVVPEIQREYVWGANSELLSKFFEDIKNGCMANTTKKDEALDSLRKNLTDSQIDPDEAIKQYYSSKYMNIGFLYSYRPFYQSNTSSSKEDLYLIDGQQRFTTLFLMLIVTARMAGDTSYNEFCKLWSNPEGVSFDYKVRDLTHDFLIRLLKNYTGRNFSETVFYHKKDAADPSIKNMIITLNEWQKCLKQEFERGKSIENYYNFLLNDVRFWHFKTEKTSQGEELYITMNARGCRLAKNETARAEMNMDPEQSRKWEGVKDFFWAHRYERRDEEWGMNEFCTWLEILFPSEKERETYWEKCFEAVSAIYNNHFFVDSGESNSKYPSRFLYAKSSPESGSKNELSKIDRFQILPVLSWYIKFADTLKTLDDSIRSKRMGDIIAFFKRISKYNSISKSIDDALAPALCMISKMVDCDIATICNNFDFSDCKAMSFPEELFKFHLSLFPPSQTDRADVEGCLDNLSNNLQAIVISIFPLMEKITFGKDYVN